MALTASSMKTKIESALNVAGYHPDYPIPDSVILALCTGIVEEITQNSELLGLTRDSGDQGAGIITGKVM